MEEVLPQTPEAGHRMQDTTGADEATINQPDADIGVKTGAAFEWAGGSGGCSGFRQLWQNCNTFNRI